MAVKETKREVMGYLGDGEKSEGTLTVEQFLELYPQGVFRPLANAVDVKLLNYQGNDKSGMYEGN